MTYQARYYNTKTKRDAGPFNTLYVDKKQLDFWIKNYKNNGEFALYSRTKGESVTESLKRI